VEPDVTGVRALHVPETGVVDFRRVARTIASEISDAGAAVATSCEVSAIEPAPGALRLRHGRGETAARAAVFCAGGWSDRLAVVAGAIPEPRVVPFRGVYQRLRSHCSHLVRGLVYPVPDPALPFLGVHLTRHPDGEVLVGPTARIAATRDVTGRRGGVADLRSTLSWPGTWRLMARHWRAGAGELRRAAGSAAIARDAARYVPGITARDLEPAFSGIRAQALARDGTLLDDFLVSETERAVHVRNAPSPAATSALALARLIVDRVERRE
jgi:2-hydroxyglutarate dehydrogenase